MAVSRPDGGEKETASIDLENLEAPDNEYIAMMFHLQDLTEVYDPMTWYERKDAPTLNDQTADRKPPEEIVTSGTVSEAAPTHS